MAPTAFSASATTDAAALDALIAGARPRQAGLGLAEAVAAMRPGWVLLEGMMPGLPRHLLLHPRHGVALLALQPGATPGSAAALGMALAACGGPPVVLLYLPQRMLHGLEAALEHAFAGRPAPPVAFCTALQRRLEMEGLAQTVALPQRPARRRYWWVVAVLAVALAAALALQQPEPPPEPAWLAQPGGMPPWPAEPYRESLAPLVLPPWPVAPGGAVLPGYAEWPPDPAPPEDGAVPATPRAPPAIPRRVRPG